MDDQQGNVIDGTERARQWRRSKPKAGFTPDDAQAWSDAPKSFAGSLLVPADMLPAVVVPNERVDQEQQGRATAAPPRACADAGESVSAEYQNPFLVPEAARVEHRSTSTRGRAIAALLASSLGSISGRRGSSRSLRRPTAMPRWIGELRLTRLLALTAVVGALVVTAVIATRPNAAHPSFASAGGATGPVGTGERGTLTAASNPFPQHATAHDRISHRARRVRTHRTVGTHRRLRPANKPEEIPARYTPPTSDSGSSTPTSTTSSYAVPTSTAAQSQPASSSGGGTTGSSSSGSSRPAFGENGTLGPGRGAPGTQ